MASSVNKVILIGNCGKDPEIRTTQTGGSIASLVIATSESWKDKSTGERKEKTEWHRISIFNEALVNIVKQYVKKGSKLYVEGALETRKWVDASGQERFTTEVVLKNYNGTLTLLDSRRGDQEGDSSYSPRDESAYEGSSTKSSSYSNSSLDDDIPF